MKDEKGREGGREGGRKGGREEGREEGRQRIPKESVLIEDFDDRYSECPHLWCLERNCYAKEKKMKRGEER